MPACLESRRHPISCLGPFSPEQGLLNHAEVSELLSKAMWPWAGNRARQMAHNAASFLADIQAETQTTGKRNHFTFRDSRSCKTVLRNLHVKNKVKTNPSD